MNPGTFYSHGKILLTGEYLVLDGARALALPTRAGQHMKVTRNHKDILEFLSLDPQGNTWFQASIRKEILKTPHDTPLKSFLIETSDEEVALTLLKMLNNISKQLKYKLLTEQGLTLTSVLEFEREWGLGSSSTFINNLASWSSTNPYAILEASLGGSGYDLACAKANGPIFYERNADQPKITQAAFNPAFKDELYFIHLNQKQNSREGIRQYRSLAKSPREEIKRINEIGYQIIQCDSLNAFESILNEHESIISTLLGIKTIKQRLFKDYKGSIKSLGAWGGDFVLATAPEDPTNYFVKRGFSTIIPYREMIL